MYGNMPGTASKQQHHERWEDVVRGALDWPDRSEVQHKVLSQQTGENDRVEVLAPYFSG